MSSKRSVMTLFTNQNCPYCHQVRMVLAEKGVVVDFVEIEEDERNEELLSLNPYGSVPTLVDRDLVLYEPNIVLEYIEERFPHPPLLPVYPVARGRSRLMMSRIRRDWYTLAEVIMDSDAKAAAKDKAKKDLQDSLLAVLPVFADSQYFLSEEFTLVDCSLAALLWRMPLYGITFPPQAKAIVKYAKRLFARDSFQQSLSEAEKEIAHEEVWG